MRPRRDLAHLHCRIATKTIELTELDDTYVGQLRGSLCWYILDVVRIFDAVKAPFLPELMAARASKHGRCFLKCYQLLASHSLFHGKTAWKLRPKLHYAAHLFEELLTTRENPRRLDLFDAEDYVGKLKRIASSCHRLSCSLRTVQRMSMFLSHRWHVCPRLKSCIAYVLLVFVSSSQGHVVSTMFVYETDIIVIPCKLRVSMC